MNPQRTSCENAAKPAHHGMHMLPIGLMALLLLASVLLAQPSIVTAASLSDGPVQRANTIQVRPHLRSFELSDSPSCFGKGCNFTNPYTTDCAGQSWDSWWVVLSGYLRDSHDNVGGYVQLWWSATCQTNWTRVVSYHHPSELEALILLQNGDGNNANATISEQFYAPTMLACSYGGIWLGPGSPTYTGQVSQYPGGC
jgi:hypothetical protein